MSRPSQMAEPEIVDAEIVDTPQPGQNPRRGPITDAFDAAVNDLGKDVKRLAALADDDRFDRNRSTIAATCLSDLQRARLIDEITFKVEDEVVIEDVSQYAKGVLRMMRQTVAPHRLKQLHASDRREFLLFMRETIKELEELEGDQSFSRQPKTSGRR